MAITIEEGDRVWFGWSKQKCAQKHCIYEILLPDGSSQDYEAYEVGATIKKINTN